MKFNLTIILSLFSFTALANECFVISGIKKDNNDFLLKKSLFRPEASKVGGKNCTIVGSWKELDKAIADKNIPKGKSILVVQGAHGTDVYDDEGNRSARFQCDADEPTSSEVLGHLNKLSSNYQVGAVIHSCYSGEIMKEKLMKDEASSANLDKLCLYTSSSIGRITYGQKQDIITQIENAKPGQTLENLFLKVRGGMISSAAWNEIGLPEYLSKKTTAEGYKVLQSLESITRGELSCATDLGAANAALCAAPGITDEIFEDLMTFQNVMIPQSVKNEVLTNFNHKLKMANAALKKAPTDKNAKAQLDCYNGLLKIYQSNFGQKLEDLASWDAIEMNAPAMRQQPFYASCVTYSKTFPKDEPRTADEIVQDNFATGSKFYQESLAKLQRRYSKRKMDESFDIKDFAKAAIGEKAVCNPDNKQQIIQSMFGDSFFMDEVAEGSADEFLWKREVSTQLALKSFQNASVTKKEMPSEIDQKRRKACRDFKF